MNNDRITEVYDGTFGTADQQRVARARIHWIGRQVEGSRVLDIGCSQGIVSILIAREGREVVGIDNEQAAIDFARDRLTAEEPAVRSRVSFELAEASRLSYDEESFDTVVLGEILEHQLDYRPLLAEAQRVLRPGGVAVITTPYGEFPYHDHKAPLYLSRLIADLSELLQLEEVELMARYLTIVARRPQVHTATVSTEVWTRALDVSERRLATVEAELRDARAKVASRAHPPAQTNAALARAEAEAAAAQRIAEEAAITVERLRSEKESVARRADQAERERDDRDDRVGELELEVDRLRRQIGEAIARADMLEQQARRLSEDRDALLRDLERLGSTSTA